VPPNHNNINEEEASVNLIRNVELIGGKEQMKNICLRILNAGEKECPALSSVWSYDP